MTWSNVMYLGGAAGVRGKSLDWDNTLTVSTDGIAFAGKHHITFQIDVSTIRALDYSGHKHMNDGAVAAGFLAGGLLGAFAGSRLKSTDHYLLIEYELPAGGRSAVLFRLHKDNQQAIIAAVRDVTKIESGD